jgi:hypothetical protein
VEICVLVGVGVDNSSITENDLNKQCEKRMCIEDRR